MAMTIALLVILLAPCAIACVSATIFYLLPED